MISVLICTYKRPVLLQKCIESVINQITTYQYEIIVCDNDIDETARGTVISYQNQNVQYYVQPLKGLSHARNMAVSKAKGEFVLFIDDDEYAEKNWISMIYQCQVKYNADVVFGKVVYEIPNTFPTYIKKSKYFKRREIKTGSIAPYNKGYSGNTLVRTKLFFIRNPPFLNEFNNSGGEDTNFFNFLHENGSKMIFCNDAVIIEIQDENRKKMKWYYIRGFHSGRDAVNRMIGHEKYFRLFICKSLTKNCIEIIILVFKTFFLPNKYFIMLIFRIGCLIGKLAYKTITKSSIY